jgi:hypothetical protein
MAMRMSRWSVYVIGGERTELIGFVTALDECRAVTEAIRVFQVPADWETRVIVSRLDTGWVRQLFSKR